MKKIRIIFLSLIAFAFAATVSAQTNTTPYQGGTYSYSLGGIYSVNGATVSIEYLDGSGANISDISPATIPAGTTTELTFNVAYESDATVGEIRVTITENVTGGCANFIDLAITPQAQPEIELDITASEEAPICQDTNPDPADNTAASSGVESNSFSFSVSSTVSNVSSAFSYVYSIDFSPETSTLDDYTITYTGDGTYDANAGTVTKTDSEADDVFTITFDTTTGVADETTVATISNTTLSVTSGGGEYTGTYTNTSASVTVKTMPSIGIFN